MKAFHCYKPVERQGKIVPLMVTLTAYETFYKVPAIDKDHQESSSEDEVGTYTVMLL